MTTPVGSAAVDFRVEMGNLKRGLNQVEREVRQTAGKVDKAAAIDAQSLNSFTRAGSLLTKVFVHVEAIKGGLAVARVATAAWQGDIKGVEAGIRSLPFGLGEVGGLTFDLARQWGLIEEATKKTERNVKGIAAGQKGLQALQRELRLLEAPTSEVRKRLEFEFEFRDRRREIIEQGTSRDLRDKQLDELKKIEVLERKQLEAQLKQATGIERLRNDIAAQRAAVVKAGPGLPLTDLSAVNLLGFRQSKVPPPLLAQKDSVSQRLAALSLSDVLTPDQIRNANLLDELEAVNRQQVEVAKKTRNLSIGINIAATVAEAASIFAPAGPLAKLLGRGAGRGAAAFGKSTESAGRAIRQEATRVAEAAIRKERAKTGRALSTSREADIFREAQLNASRKQFGDRKAGAVANQMVREAEAELAARRATKGGGVALLDILTDAGHAVSGRVFGGEAGGLAQRERQLRGPLRAVDVDNLTSTRRKELRQKRFALEERAKELQEKINDARSEALPLVTRQTELLRLQLESIKSGFDLLGGEKQLRSIFEKAQSQAEKLAPSDGVFSDTVSKQMQLIANAAGGRLRQVVDQLGPREVLRILNLMDLGAAPEGRGVDELIARNVQPGFPDAGREVLAALRDQLPETLPGGAPATGAGLLAGFGRLGGPATGRELLGITGGEPGVDLRSSISGKLGLIGGISAAGRTPVKQDPELLKTNMAIKNAVERTAAASQQSLSKMIRELQQAIPAPRQSAVCTNIPLETD